MKKEILYLFFPIAAVDQCEDEKIVCYSSILFMILFYFIECFSLVKPLQIEQCLINTLVHNSPTSFENPRPNL